MNEKNLQKVDYLLALVPILIFIYPIIIFGGAFFNWYDVEDLMIPLTYAYIFIIVFLASIGWGYKFILKIKPTEKNNIFLIIAYSCFALVVGLSEGLLLFFILNSFLSLTKVEGTSQVVWEVLLGFVFIVILKVLGDLHYLPTAYNNVINWIHTKLD